MRRKRNGEEINYFTDGAEVLEFGPGGFRPLYFKRPDSEKIFGIPSRVLEDLAMKKQGPPFYKRGKYAIYEVATFIKWLTENPVQTTGND